MKRSEAALLPRPRRHGVALTPVLAACAALCASTGALAQAGDPNPYYVGVSETIAHDSNVYRVSPATPDWYSTTSLLGGFDQMVGRQRLHANGTVGLARYRNVTNLNNTNYGLNAGWDWATIEKLSGTVTAQANRSLATFTDATIDDPAASNRGNLVSTEQFGATGRWGGDSVLTLDGGYTHNRVRYSETPTANATDDSGSIGLSYRAGGALRLGAAFRLSHTDSPQGGVNGGSNTVNGRYVDLFADWQPTALSFVNTRLSWAHQKNSDVAGRDFSGLTGALNGSWAATGKITVNGSLSREAGINGGFFGAGTNPPVTTTVGNTTTTTAPTNDFSTPVGLSQSSQVTNSASLGLSYAATAKISANLKGNWRRSKVVDVNGDRNDDANQYSLGISYAIARAWNLGCDFGHATRDLEGSPTQTYSANTASCTAQFTFR